MSTSPCDACAAPCCRLYHVGIDAFDAYRITTQLGLPMRDFVGFKSKRVPDHEFRILFDGACRPEERKYFCLSLGKTRARAAGGPNRDDIVDDQRCVFLMEVGGYGRCGIYAHRPGVCRVYPTLDTNGVISTDGGGRYCPPGAWQAQAVAHGEFRVRWRHHRLHRWLHQDLVDGWNEHVITFREEAHDEQFFSFVLRAYGDLERHEPQLFEDRLIDLNPAEVRAALDRALRRIGWRTDETARQKDPSLGWRPASTYHLEPAANLDASSVLVLDPDEDIDPWGSKMIARLRQGMPTR